MGAGRAMAAGLLRAWKGGGRRWRGRRGGHTVHPRLNARALALQLRAQGAFSADGALALGGPLGGMAGGLPMVSPEGCGPYADLSALRTLLLRPPEAVCLEALRLFTRQLLTGAEAEPGADRHALTVDLSKLSSEELNLACARGSPAPPAQTRASRVRASVRAPPHSRRPPLTPARPRTADRIADRTADRTAAHAHAAPLPTPTPHPCPRPCRTAAHAHAAPRPCRAHTHAVPVGSGAPASSATRRARAARSARCCASTSTSSSYHSLGPL